MKKQPKKRGKRKVFSSALQRPDRAIRKAFRSFSLAILDKVSK
jgi:hypothetical protein